MTKPKLTDALKTKSTPAASDTGTDPDAVVAPPLGSDTGSAGEPAADASDSAADSDKTAETDAANSTDAPAADAQPAADVHGATLQQFRDVFGHAEGSALYLDSADFSAACVSHIKDLQAAAAKATAEIAELRAQNKELAAKALGESDPVATHIGGDTSHTSDPVSSYAAGLLQKS